MGMEECTCCDEHWEMYGNVKSLDCTPETKIILYVNYTSIKKRQKSI